MKIWKVEVNRVQYDYDLEITPEVIAEVQHWVDTTIADSDNCELEVVVTEELIQKAWEGDETDEVLNIEIDQFWTIGDRIYDTLDIMVNGVVPVEQSWELEYSESGVEE